MTPTKCIKFGLLNAGSLGTNQDQFLIAMSNYSVDIMAINETWLRKGEDDRAPSVPGYRLKHIPRPTTIRGGRGGGVAFYLKNGITARIRAHPEHSNVEQLWLNLNVSKNKLLIGTAYRPPWLELHSFLDALTDSISGLAPYDHLILLGDFNVNMLDVDSTKTKELTEFLNYFNVQQLVQTPTHYVGDSSSLIDIVCTDAPTRNVNVYNIGELGHHSFITCETIFKKPKLKPRSVVFRPLKNILEDYFITDLGNIPWATVSDMSNVNDMVQAFNIFVNQLFDLHAPLKSMTFKTRPTPWITDNVRLISKMRDEARARFHKSKLPGHKQYYLQLKHQAITALDSEKKSYFTKSINDHVKDPKLLWRNLKSDVLPDHTQRLLPGHFNNPDEINAAFLDVPGNCHLNVSKQSYFESHRFGDATFSLTTTNAEAVLKIIKSLGSNAQGVDCISLDMISLTLPNTLQAITDIINCSITTSTFPELWRCAIVRPISKNNNPVSTKDLRPISILPCLSKILERVVYSQVVSFLEANKILPDLQSGFRQGRGTATALADVVGNILEARDRGEGTILALLDFSRAFDAINTNLLLSKLAFYGFGHDAVEWFRSYLSDRSQFVELHREDGSRVSSAPLCVSRGVPQGSILGPLLYILYSADITESFIHCKYHMYADDIQLYISFKAEETSVAVQKINEDLQRVVEWSEENSLVLNPLKSKFMVLGSRNQVCTILTAICVDVMGETIERVRLVCNLGLTMDPELRFEAHVNNVLAKLLL
uniref:Reverse transcriptase domain-containing protein n=1 Tax=Heliothis virescens TaxID=7102 RepID=A0A2A4JM54_HELVI